MKKGYSKPWMIKELFRPEAYCTGCTQSSHGSPDGKFVYGWVLKCESVTSGGVTYGHDHNKCPNDGYFEKQDGSGTVDGTFVRAKDQTQASNFNVDNVDANTAFWIDYDNVSGLSPGDWWIIDNHAFKVQGSNNTVSYPVSARYDVNHS